MKIIFSRYLILNNILKFLLAINTCFMQKAPDFAEKNNLTYLWRNTKFSLNQ
jgi:hypothetical protein